MTPEQIKLVRSILERVQEIIEHTYPYDENPEWASATDFGIESQTDFIHLLDN